MTIHDYTKRGWGHDYTFEPINKGLEAHMTGWGCGIESGDYLFLKKGEGFSLYKVITIDYESDPSDMWNADVDFAPITEERVLQMPTNEREVFERFFATE